MIYVVSGTPRGFTSCMMRCLSKGLSTAYDTKRNEFAKDNGRHGYLVNPHNQLYEFTQQEITTLGFPRQHEGKLIKVFASWLPCLCVHEYKVVFILRPAREVRQSLIEFNRKRLDSGVLPFEAIPSVDAIDQDQQEGLLVLRNRRDVKVTSVFSSSQLLNDTKRVFESLAHDGWPINAQSASSVVDTKLHRTRLNGDRN